MNAITHSFFTGRSFKKVLLVIFILFLIHIGFAMKNFPERASVATNAFGNLMDLMIAPAFADQVILDDLIVDGSLGVGSDSVNGQNFGFDTIILKENNLRVFFDDTSSTSSFPKNDWRIIINDSGNGGASYFAVEDATAGRVPFKIEAGAPSNSLYVDDFGNIGIGTESPLVEIHIKDSDTPDVRLEQDWTGGWTPQTWDVAGNESNFFIRDVTNGSKLPFRIQPGTPSSTLCLKSGGYVGIGTWSPAAPLELVTNSSTDAEFLFQRTNGATGILGASGTTVFMGSKTNHPLDFVVNDEAAMTIETDGTVHVVGNAIISGNLDLGSSRDLKKNIHPLQTKEAVDALKELRPVKYNYKIDPDEESIGFIAEEVPDLVATNSRKTLSPMDIVAVLAKVAQNQQKVIEQLSRRVIDLEKRLNAKSRGRSSAF